MLWHWVPGRQTGMSSWHSSMSESIYNHDTKGCRFKREMCNYILHHTEDIQLLVLHPGGKLRGSTKNNPIFSSGSVTADGSFSFYHH